MLFGGPERTRVIVLLGCVLALSSADAATVGAAATPLRRALHIGNGDIGLLVTVSSLVAAIFSLPFGVLADRVKRTRLLGLTILLWGAAMLWSAASTSFSELLLARLALGAVTASAGPVVASMIGDYFPSGERGRVYGYILTGELIGAGFGFAVTGDIASLSWRAAFVILAVPAFLLARVIMRMPEPARGAAQPLAYFGDASVPESDEETPTGSGPRPAPTSANGAGTPTDSGAGHAGGAGHGSGAGHAGGRWGGQTGPRRRPAPSYDPFPYPHDPYGQGTEEAPAPAAEARTDRWAWTGKEWVEVGPEWSGPDPTRHFAAPGEQTRQMALPAEGGSGGRGGNGGTRRSDTGQPGQPGQPGRPGQPGHAGPPRQPGGQPDQESQGRSPLDDDTAPEDRPHETDAQRVARERGIRPDEDMVLRTDASRMGMWAAVRYLLRIRTNLILIIASACAYFYLSGVETFASEFTSQQYRIATPVANTLLLVIGIGAVVGVLVGGNLSDYLLRRRYVNSRVAVAAAAALLTAVLFIPAILTRSVVAALPYLTFAGFALMAQNPPIDAGRLDIVPPLLWGRAEGLRSLLRTGAQSLAPVAFGTFADLLGGGRVGLKWAFLVMLLPLFANGVILLLALRTYPRDVATAAAAPPPPSAEAA
ncbi:MAG TPA: MFS transporter [Acidimicrobiales bacterium]|nr:MFS transporter [Acidimicrobiales bacterium]